MRLFVAIPMPEPCAAALASVSAALPFGRLIDEESLHLTLAFLGETDRLQAEEVHMALESIHAAPFELQPKGLGTFSGRSPEIVWAGVADPAPVVRLAAKVRSVLHGAGVQLDHRRFNPHITLARVTRPGPEGEAKLARFLSKWDSFPAPVARIDRFALYRSHLRPEGSLYEILAEYDLQ